MNPEHPLQEPKENLPPPAELTQAAPRPGSVGEPSANAPKIVGDDSVNGPASAERLVTPDKIMPSGETLYEAEVRWWVDGRLCEIIRAAGPDSRAACDLRRELKEYGEGELSKVYRQGFLFRRLTRMGICSLRRPPVGFNRHIDALIFMTIQSALSKFMQDYIFGRLYDPTKSSLKKSFSNACLIEFAAEYRRFTKEETLQSGWEDMENDDYEPDLRQKHGPRPTPDPETTAVNRSEIERLLAGGKGIDSTDKIILYRTAQGWTQKDIALEFSMTESAVNSRLRRTRNKILKQEAGDGQ